MKKYILLSLAAIAILSTGCRKEAPEFSDPTTNISSKEPSDIFKSFWHGMNNSYIFWDIDPTNWDDVYDEYLPQFQKLDGTETVKTSELEAIYLKLTKTLIDHHYGIEIQNPKAPEGDPKSFKFKPGLNEVMSRPYAHERLVAENLVPSVNKNIDEGRIKDFLTGESVVGGATVPVMHATTYNIDNGIVYLYLNTFMLTSVINDVENPVIKVLHKFWDLLKTEDIKGVIIDIRSNNGGYVHDANYVLASMIDKPFCMGYSRTKSGQGRLDYTAWTSCIVYPNEKSVAIDVPIVGLVDILSTSMAEISAMSISKMPNGCIIGERTYGATGPLMGYFNYSYSGTFKNNVVYIYTSTNQFKDRDGKIYEGVGVTPNIEALLDRDALLDGNDTQLERAIKYINEKN